MHKKADHAQDVGALSKSMLIVMALTVVGKVSGFVREIFMSRQYGITAVADAINTALNVPCFFLSAIVIALAATFIPVYSGRLQHSPGEANRFTNNLLTLGGVFTIVVLLLTYVFIEPLITGFLLKHHGRDTQEIAVRLSKWMMPMGLFMFLARMASAHLQANFRFTIPALSQICYNIVLIGAILVAGKLDVTYIAMGAVLGWVLQFIVQAPSMRRAGLSYRPVWDCKEPGLRQVLVLMIPVLIAGVFDTLYVGFDKSIASQVSGDISSLDYADRLTAMVSAILPVTIATVLYPSLVRHVGEPGKMSQDISFGVNVNLFISIPATIALLLLCRPITRLVYERGSFTPENTLSVAPLLACYAAGIFGVGLRELCNRCFFAYKDVKIPTAVGVGVILLKIGLNYILYPLWGAPGLAVATSFSWLLSGFALLFLLHLRQRVVGWRAILACLWKVAAATAAMSAALLLLSAGLKLDTLSGMSFPLMMAVVIALGLIVYAVALALLRSDELTMVLSVIRKKLKKG